MLDYYPLAIVGVTWVSRNSTAPATDPVQPQRSTVDQN